MPTPKLFKKFSSNNNASGTSSATSDAQPDHVPRPIVDPSEPAYSDVLKEAWAAAHKELPEVHGADKVLNKIGGSILISSPRCLPFDPDFGRKADVQEVLELSSEQQTVVDTLATPAKELMNTSHITDTIHKGVDTFMEAVPLLVKALDEVAKAHPFINGTTPFFFGLNPANGAQSNAVAVLAFKAVYTLETKRRENDKRVLALYVEYVPSNFDPQSPFS